jgi:P27 family predicted phage terminase small subunit
MAKKQEVNLSDLCPEAQKYLIDLRKVLKDSDVLTSLDDNALEMIGNSYHNFVQATTILRKDGLVFYSKSGEPKSHPAVKIQLDASIQLTKLFESFGLTPKSRKELAKPKEKEGKLSPMDIYLSNAKKKLSPMGIYLSNAKK